MAITYNDTLKTTRMTAVVTAIDAGSGAGTIEICTANYAAVIVTIALNDPCGAVGGAGTVVLTFDNTPAPAGVASLAGTNTAAIARIKDSNAVIIANGLTVGVGTGDVQLNSTSITQGQTVTLTSATITHG